MKLLNDFTLCMFMDNILRHYGIYFRDNLSVDPSTDLLTSFMFLLLVMNRMGKILFRSFLFRLILAALWIKLIPPFLKIQFGSVLLDFEVEYIVRWIIRLWLNLFIKFMYTLSSFLSLLSHPSFYCRLFYWFFSFPINGFDLLLVQYWRKSFFTKADSSEYICNVQFLFHLFYGPS